MADLPALEISGFTSRRVERRGLIFLGVLAGHLCLILLLVLSRQTVPPKKQHGALSVFAMAASPSPPAIPKIKPIISVETVAVLSTLADAQSAQQSADGDPDGEACSPLDAVTAQLTTDPMVPLAINRVPRANRSISDAIVMWNAEWSAAAAAEEAPLADVRDSVLLILETLPPDCLADPVIGPRLIAIPEEDNTTFLAFGSGEWSWQQLLESEVARDSGKDSWSWERLLAGELPTIF